jgi:site-specific DNA-cytosine methylase
MNLEIFGCAAGMGEGFRRAGIHFDVVVDWDADARASYKNNIGVLPIGMDARDFLRLIEAGMRLPDLDLLVADPPCTPWSRAGKRLGIDDERDMLRVTCEIIRLLKPRAYLIGNVPGLEDMTQWHHLQAALDPLRRAGYCIRDFATLDAADFGVPQHRIRPFWFGHLDGPCVAWPLPTHTDPKHGDMFGLQPWVTCRDALGHLSGAELGRPVRLRRRDNPTVKDIGRAGTKPRASMADSPVGVVTARENQGDGSVLVVPHGHPRSQADAPAPALTTRPSRQGRSATTLVVNDRHLPADADADADAAAPTLGAKDRGQSRVVVGLQNRANPSDADQAGATLTTNTHGAGALLTVSSKHPSSSSSSPANTVTGSDGGGSKRALSWPWDRPSTVVFDDERINAPGHHAQSNLSDENAVLLSERAAAILQGFPDGDAPDKCPRCGGPTGAQRWHFCGATKKARWSMIGQAMPPPLAHAVATAIAKQRAQAREPRPEGQQEK